MNIDDTPYLVYNAKLIYIDSKIYVFGELLKSGDYSFYLLYNFPQSFDYDHNSLVIVPGNAYKTKLFGLDNSIKGDIDYEFNDVLYYINSSFSLIDNMEAYYGDGYQWIKFKDYTN